MQPLRTMPPGGFSEGQPKMPAAKHAIRRTSPKGQDFVGTCVLCGTAGLAFVDASRECPNQRGISAEEALIEVLKD